MKSQPNILPILVVFSVLVIIGTIGGIYYYQNSHVLEARQPDPNTPSITPETPIEATIVASPAQVSTTITALEDGAKRFDNAAFAFKYTPDFTFQEYSPTNVRIYKWGSTQQGQTELYDGMMITFMSGDLAGKSLSEYVKQRETASEENATVTKAMAPITLNDQHGYTYTAEGLGTATMIYLPGSNGKFVEVSYINVGPDSVENQTIINRILSSVVVK